MAESIVQKILSKKIYNRHEAKGTNLDNFLVVKLEENLKESIKKEVECPEDRYPVGLSHAYQMALVLAGVPHEVVEEYYKETYEGITQEIDLKDTEEAY